MAKIKEFIQRHSFILIIVVAVLVATTNFLIYPVFINKQLNLVDVPISNITIEENQLITKEMITTVSMDPKLLPTSVELDEDKIIGKYVKGKCTIPAQGFFADELMTDSVTALGKAYSNLKEGEYAYTLTLPESFQKASLFKNNQYINVYYYEEFVNEEGTKAFQAGQLAENKRVVDIVEDVNNGTQLFVTIALSEDEIGYFLLAEQIGTVIPALNWQSNGLNFRPTTYYDIINLKTHLSEMSKIYNLVVEPEVEAIKDSAEKDNASKETKSKR